MAGGERCPSQGTELLVLNWESTRRKPCFPYSPEREEIREIMEKEEKGASRGGIGDRSPLSGRGQAGWRTEDLMKRRREARSLRKYLKSPGKREGNRKRPKKSRLGVRASHGNIQAANWSSNLKEGGLLRTSTKGRRGDKSREIRFSGTKVTRVHYVSSRDNGADSGRKLLRVGLDHENLR